MTKVTQKDGQEFERFWNSRPEVAEYDAHGAAWSGYQAACQYKGEQLQELDSLLRPANPETPRIGDMKLALEALLREHKAYAEHIDLLEARIAELEAKVENLEKLAAEGSTLAADLNGRIFELEAQRDEDKSSSLPRVPEGYVLMPANYLPEDMERAAVNAAREYMERTGGNCMKVIYKALVDSAASPALPKAGDVGTPTGDE